MDTSHHNDTSIKTNVSLLEDSMVYHLNESSHRSESHFDSFIVNETLSNSQRFLDSGRMSRLDGSFLNTTRTMDTLDEEMAATFLGHYTASRFSWNNLILGHQHGMASLAFQG
jgi:hypothetical protein